MHMITHNTFNKYANSLCVGECTPLSFKQKRSREMACTVFVEIHICAIVNTAALALQDIVCLFVCLNRWKLKVNQVK